MLSQPSTHTDVNVLLYEKLVSHINEDVVINHIYPYSMTPQPSSLLHDIRSYSEDTSLIYSIYYTQHNAQILSTDLSYYLNNTYTLPSLGRFRSSDPAYLHIYGRTLTMGNATPEEVKNLFVSTWYEGTNTLLLEKHIRRVIGLMTPRERTDFINRYIIDEEDEEDL